MDKYELTVYHTVDNCGYSIVEKTFDSISELLTYCKDFDTENHDLLFDVWENSVGQFNVNDAVEAIKVER